MKDRVLLIDYANFVFRGKIKFGKPDPSKVDYTLIFNFFRNLRALIEQLEPKRVFLVAEGHPGFRYQLLSSYKANRLIKLGTPKGAADKADFDRQRDIISQLTVHLPVMMVRAANYEADDTINALVENLTSEEVIIVSGDKDFIQILQKHKDADIRLYNPVKKEFITAPTYHFLAMLALAGDTSDNIPSVVSENKAIELASNPGLLKEFLAIEENRVAFQLNRELIELRHPKDDELEFQNYTVNYNLLKEEFAKMEFASMLTEKYWDRFVSTFEALK